MKSSMALVSFFALSVIFSSTVSASSQTQVYKKFTGSNWVVGSYAKTIEAVSYDQIEVINQLKVNGVLYDINSASAINDYWCQTAELTTGSYDSRNAYKSTSVHTITDDGEVVSETLSNASL